MTVLDDQAVTVGKGAGIAAVLEQIGVPDALRGTLLGIHKDPARAWQKNSHGPVLSSMVMAQNVKRIVMPPLDESHDVCMAR